VNFRQRDQQRQRFASSGGSIDANGRSISPGDFGRITATSNNPRLIQLALKLNF
jgi:hypothetical protein